TVANTARVKGAEGDPNSFNDLARVETTVLPPAAASADLTVTLGAAATLIQGHDLTYTVGVTNHGPDAATAVTLTDTLPLGVTVVSAVSSQGPTPRRSRDQLIAALGGLDNTGFEDPARAPGPVGYVYNPTGTAWSYDTGSGVAANNSGFTAG